MSDEKMFPPEADQPSATSPTSDARPASASPSEQDPLSELAHLPDDTVVCQLDTGKRRAGRRDAALTPDFSGVRHALGLTLSDDALRYIRGYCRRVLHRLPTIGELRVLDRLARVPREGDVGHRHVLCGLTTASPAIAETWADMMEKHAALTAAEGMLPPPTYEDALSMTRRALFRMGNREALPQGIRKGQSPVPPREVLFSPTRELEVAAAGFSVVARVRLSNGTDVAVTRRGWRAFSERAPRTGDVILWAEEMSAVTLGEFVDSQSRMSKPDVNAIRTVTTRSLLETAAELTGGMDLYAYTLEEKGEARRLPIERLCGEPTVKKPSRGAVLLCAPVSRATYVVSDLKRRGVETIAIGQVRRDSKMAIYVKNPATGGQLLAACPSVGLLERMQTAEPHDCAPSVADAFVSVERQALARLPGNLPAESGVTPAGRETVALTAAPTEVLTLADERICLAAAGTVVERVGDGYRAAMDAVSTVIEALQMGTATVSLSVSLRVRPGAYDSLTEVVCGLYRVTAERGIRMTHDLRITEEGIPEGADAALTAVAWTQSMPASETNDSQWTPHTTQSHSSSGEPSVRFLQPTLRRSMEGSLNALTRALNCRMSTTCSLQPLVIERREVQIPVTPSETEVLPSSKAEAGAAVDTAVAAESAVPADVWVRVERREELAQASADKLAAVLPGDAVPIFAMSEGDAHLLLRHETVRAALEQRLERGGTVIVLGEACCAFATCGYLPEELYRVPAVSADGVVEVHYCGIPEEPPARRLLRGSLLSPVCGHIPHLLELTREGGVAPGSMTVPDGFVGHDGLVLGLLNGVDIALERYVRRPRFPVGTSNEPLSENDGDAPLDSNENLDT